MHARRLEASADRKSGLGTFRVQHEVGTGGWRVHLRLDGTSMRSLDAGYAAWHRLLIGDVQTFHAAATAVASAAHMVVSRTRMRFFGRLQAVAAACDAVAAERLLSALL